MHLIISIAISWTFSSSHQSASSLPEGCVLFREPCVLRVPTVLAGTLAAAAGCAGREWLGGNVRQMGLITA